MSTLTPDELMNPVTKAAATPCRGCPWRPSNQGKPTPGGWYSKANLRRLWAGLRRGERMTCHPTDPRMAELDSPDGFRPAPATAETRECTGAVVLALREMDLLTRVHDSDIAAYTKARPGGLTRHGIGRIVERLLWRTWTTDYNLAQPDLDHPTLTWRPPT